MPQRCSTPGCSSCAGTSGAPGRGAVSIRATGAWELSGLYAAWENGGLEAAYSYLAEPGVIDADQVRRGLGRLPFGAPGRGQTPDAVRSPTRAGGMGQRRVLVHASGFKQSPYADVKTPGEDPKKPPRKLWHSSPGSSGA